MSEQKLLDKCIKDMVEAVLNAARRNPFFAPLSNQEIVDILYYEVNEVGLENEKRNQK